MILPFLLMGCKLQGEIKEKPKMDKAEIEEKISNNELKIATFAGGCFWCMEAGFQEEDGIIEVISGYVGGDKENPNYEEVSSGKTGHFEAIQVYYNPKRIKFKKFSSFIVCKSNMDI